MAVDGCAEGVFKSVFHLRSSVAKTMLLIRFSLRLPGLAVALIKWRLGVTVLRSVQADHCWKYILTSHHVTPHPREPNEHAIAIAQALLPNRLSAPHRSRFHVHVPVVTDDFPPADVLHPAANLHGAG